MLLQAIPLLGAEKPYFRALKQFAAKASRYRSTDDRVYQDIKNRVIGIPNKASRGRHYESRRPSVRLGDRGVQAIAIGLCSSNPENPRTGSGKSIAGCRIKGITRPIVYQGRAAHDSVFLSCCIAKFMLRIQHKPDAC